MGKGESEMAKAELRFKGNDNGTLVDSPSELLYLLRTGTREMGKDVRSPRMVLQMQTPA